MCSERIRPTQSTPNKLFLGFLGVATGSEPLPRLTPSQILWTEFYGTKMQHEIFGDTYPYFLIAHTMVTMLVPLSILAAKCVLADPHNLFVNRDPTFISYTSW